jgi:uncharacterized protein DUF6370
MLRFACAVLCLGLILGVAGADEKEKTLKGTITCAKCDLGVAKACATVIKVKDGDKDVVYYFDSAAHKKYHGDTCKEAKEGTVTGTVSKSGDKMMVKVSKLEYK